MVNFLDYLGLVGVPSRFGATAGRAAFRTLDGRISDPGCGPIVASGFF
jgi:hypothetical protein